MPGRATNRWVWVAGPDYYLDENGNDHPELVPNAARASNGWWTCHRDTRKGDLVVLYRSQTAKDIAYVIRVLSDAYPLADVEHGEPAWEYACDYTVLEKLARPIPISELRSDPVVAQWPALRASFVRSTFPVPPKVWDHLMTMASTSGRHIQGRIEQSVSTELSEATIAAELQKRPDRFEPHGYRMKKLCREVHIPGHGLADLVYFNPDGNPRVVIELKKGPATTGAVAQIVDYRAGLTRRYPQGQRIKGVLVADSIDRRTRALLDAVPALEFIPLDSLDLSCLQPR